MTCEADLQADALADLNTTHNKLSVWQVQENLSNLDQIITALAANCDKVSKLDYLIFDSQILQALQIEDKPTPGESGHYAANKWHVDLADLSALKLVRLAKSLLDDSTIDRKQEKEVLRLVVKAVQVGELQLGKLQVKIKLAVLQSLVQALNSKTLAPEDLPEHLRQAVLGYSKDHA